MVKLIYITFPVVLAAMLHAEPSAMLGKVGDIEVKTADVRETLAGLGAGQRAQLAKDPEALNQYVRALLLQRLVLSEAVAKEWDQEPAVIAKLVRAREAALAESYLTAVSEPEPGYPTEDDLAKAYEANKAKLEVPRSWRLAQIFIAAEAGTDAKAKLAATLKRLKAKDADFAGIARTASDEPASAAKGGEIGWLAEAQIQPEIRAKLPQLKLRAVSEPIQLHDGWHILKVLDIREAHTPPLAEVRDPLAARLRDERARTKRAEFITGLLKEHPAAVNEIELSKLLATPGG